MTARTEDDLVSWYQTTRLVGIAGHQEDVREFLVSKETFKFN